MKSCLHVPERNKNHPLPFISHKSYIVDQKRLADQVYPIAISFGELLGDNHYMKFAPNIPRYMFAMCGGDQNTYMDCHVFRNYPLVKGDLLRIHSIIPKFYYWRLSV